ncbi:MAG TPA: NAD(P)/FAD-dependent oxidoreductase [Modestobacter sp.]|nr:NAD(P)/FAD-dependent oxidoreductase [Modestobacter sp.]
MTTAQQTYDVVVLGAGSTGENVADIAVRGGLSAVLVESELVGGECSYWACMPSKTLLRGSEALAEARAVRGAAAAVTGEQDVAATLARRDDFTSHWDDAGQVRWVHGAGIDLVRGHGRLAGEKRVVVRQSDGTEVLLLARHAVAVCTGSTAAIPPVEGLADVQPWTSREVTSAKEAPARLLVLGGGYVGCELATAWQQLGSSVTLLQHGDRLLPQLEPAAGEAVEAALRELGVDVRLGTEVRSARREGDEVVLAFGDDAAGEEVRGEEVLVATGRAPNTGDIGLDTVGLEPGGWLQVDESLQVDGTPWLYGVGDANGRRLLTHMGKYQARQAGNAIVARARGELADLADWSPFVATADRRATPSVLFTDPQVASVGMTAAQAAEEGLPHRVVEYPIGSVAGAAVFADGYTGTAIAVVDTEREVLLGVTFIGSGVAELLHSATIAVVGEVPISRLWHAVPSYPTISEVWLRLLETFRG